METLSNLIDQVRAILIQTEDKKQKHEIYNQFINECKVNSLTEDDFYKKVLKIAHKSIDWNYIEEEKKRKVEIQKKLSAELAEQEHLIQSAPIYIDRLVKTAFEDGVVEAGELKKIFEKAVTLSQDIHALAEKIDALFDERNYKSYPKANLDAPTLKETLCSSNWYNADHYTKLTTPPPPPPEPFPWKIVITSSVLILVIGGIIGYQFFYKPFARDRDAPRYYTFANDAILRSSQVAGVDHNKIIILPYGTELITYNYGSEWSFAKTNEKEGYVASKLILDKKDFYLLNSIFGDNESKGAIETIKCRKALLKYFKEKNFIGKIDETVQKEVFGLVQNITEVWQVFTKGKDAKPNTFLFPKIINPNSKFTDFAVIIKNINTGKRHLLFFAFTDTEEPILTYEEDAPDIGDILSIRRNQRKGPNVFDVKYAFN